MPSVITRTLLFISSYFPLLLIVFLERLQEQPTLAWTALGAGFAGILGIGVYLLALRQLQPVTVNVAAVSRKDAEVMAYIMTYVIKFLAIPWDKPRQVVSLGVFFVVLGVLYVSNNFIHINPTLNMLGFKLFEIQDGAGATYSLLARRRVLSGQPVSVRRASGDVLIEVP
jgi:hypothetical protein